MPQEAEKRRVAYKFQHSDPDDSCRLADEEEFHWPVQVSQAFIESKLILHVLCCLKVIQLRQQLIAPAWNENVKPGYRASMLAHDCSQSISACTQHSPPYLCKPGNQKKRKRQSEMRQARAGVLRKASVSCERSAVEEPSAKASGREREMRKKNQYRTCRRAGQSQSAASCRELIRPAFASS